jgi:uncharacterized protein (TIGR02145 family)
MKKLIPLLVILFGSISLFAQQEPLIKFYLNDGNIKQFNLSDIENLSFNNKNENIQLIIYSKGSGKVFYPPYLIDNIKIEKDNLNKSILSVYISGFPKRLDLTKIDSLCIVKTDYPAITIGNQIWMAKNLDVDHYRNGDFIPQVTNAVEWINLTTDAWSYYEFDSAMGAIYGKLYNWYAVNDPRRLAPTGWHVPSDPEWKILELYLGMKQTQADTVAWRGMDEGGKLKETGTSHWQIYNSGATNESGFSALPGGYHSHDGPSSISSDGYWWTSTEKFTNYPWYRSLRNYYSNILRSYESKGNGFSVRCIKDNNTNTPNISSINPIPAAIGDIITISGFGFGTEQGTNFVSISGAKPNEYLCWNDMEIKVKIPTNASSGKVSVTVNGEMSNELDIIIIVYGEVTDIDNNKYKTVQIGTQIWMAENLNVSHYRNGDSIIQVLDKKVWSNLNTGAWSNYNYDTALGRIYGKLYNWHAVNDQRGLAPSGWHIPSNNEWKILENYLGGYIEAGKMKEPGTSHWLSPNSEATNESGFTALPGGSCAINGTFSNIGANGYWWTSTEYYASMAWYRSLDYQYPSIYNSTDNKGNGFSVRCVKD